MEGGGHQLIESLYFTLLDSWNKMDAGKFAGLFSEDGNVVGFDGSAANGKDEIEQHLSAIFSNHKVATYVGIVREVRFLTPEVVVLRAVAGMVPPGAKQDSGKKQCCSNHGSTEYKWPIKDCSVPEYARCL